MIWRYKVSEAMNLPRIRTSTGGISRQRRTLVAAVSTLAGSTLLGVVLVAAASACSDAAFRETMLRIMCWTLVVGGVTGTFLAGAGMRCGWLVLLGMQPLWVAYALVTGQIGFVPGSLAYAGAQLNGYLRSQAAPPRGTDRASEPG